MTVLIARAGASPLLVGAARLWIAAVLLVLAARTTVRVAAPRDLRRCVLMGACMAGYQAAYFTAVTLSGITMTALIAICSAPLMIAGLAPAALGERLTPRVRFALGLGVAGTALLVAAPQGILELTARLVAGALLTFTAGAVLLTPAVLWTEAPLRQLTLGWPWLLYLGGVATAGAYAVYSLGLRRVPASVAGVVTLLEPLTATLLGVAVFGERLGASGVVGAVLLFSALGLLTPRAVSADV